MSDNISTGGDIDRYRDLNTPNRYDEKALSLLRRPEILKISAKNPKFSPDHPDYKNGDSPFWQTANGEIRNQILAKQVQLPIEQRRSLGEGKPANQTWYRDTMSLLLTLEIIEMSISENRAKKIRKISEVKPDVPTIL